MERDGNCSVRERARLSLAREGFIRERKNAAFKAARARGRKGRGRYKLDEEQVAHAKAVYADKTNIIDDICKTLLVSLAPLSRYVRGRQRPS
jgi:DNA invertase Pin-like site-specific DNA recombinase